MQRNTNYRKYVSRRIASPGTDVSTKKSRIGNAITLIAFYPIAFLYLELLLKSSLGGNIFDKYLGYILLFALSGGFLFYFFCNLSSSAKLNRTLSICVLSVITLLFLVEFFCRQTFKFYMGLRVIFGMTGDVVQSYSVTIIGMVLRNLHFVILFLLPLVIYIFLLKKPLSRRISPMYAKILPFVSSILCYGLALIFVYTSASGAITAKEFYTSNFDMTESSLRFGLLTSFRLDTEYLIFGAPMHESTGEENLDNLTPSPSASEPDPTSSTAEPTPSYGDNVMDIDFDTLIANEKDSTLLKMHEYFSTVTPTKQNEYTGMFEGKNLIFLVAESFSPYLIDREDTPTLYMLANTGFVFNDYYQPAWGVSTSDGEYSSLIGLVPKSGEKSMLASKDNNLYFTSGNQLLREGYLSLAYHNNTYTYYSRNLTHVNLGYSKFTAIGNGLEGLTKCWPKSDLEMFEHSVDDYINNKPFNVYYMTVSGHPAYSFTGNMMAYKNKAAVAELDYSDTVKAYLACNRELEYAMEYLINRLEEAGILDDTVIVLTADHYPYGLEQGFEGNTKDYISELAGHTVEKNFELYKNTLILWSGSMETPVIIDEPCYSLDILPTLSNLFGWEYDSRLLVGRDVLSGTMPLVLFRNYSWITDLGKFNASTETFTPNPGVTVPENYVKTVSSIVKNKINYSKYILEKDYYGVLFGKN